MAVFLIPAAVMVFAINLFPKLLNYLSTGSLGAQKVIVIDAPQSFMDFPGKKQDLYKYEFVTSGGPEDVDFDATVKEGYRKIFQENKIQNDLVNCYVFFDQEKFLTEAKADQYTVDVLDAYKNYLHDMYFEEFVGKTVETFTVDEYNPITFILNNRSVANTAAAHVIPGIMAILMYYCSYSLACDMIAMEKNRGFLNKLVMTPASPKAI